MKTLRLLPILFLCATAWPQAFGPIFGPNIPNNATSFVLTNILNGTNAAGILENLSAPRYVSTFADLASAGTDGPSISMTLGKASSGDGGEGTFRRVAASTYATNAVTIVNGVGCQWARVFDGPLPARAAGTGNWATDAKACFDAGIKSVLIDAASGNAATNIVVPEKSLLTIAPNLTLAMAGQHIQLAGDDAAIDGNLSLITSTYAGADTNYCLVRVQKTGGGYQYRNKIDNIRLEGNHYTQVGHGLGLIGLSGARVRNVFSKEFYGSGCAAMLIASDNTAGNNMFVCTGINLSDSTIGLWTRTEPDAGGPYITGYGDINVLNVGSCVYGVYSSGNAYAVANALCPGYINITGYFHQMSTPSVRSMYVQGGVYWRVVGTRFDGAADPSYKAIEVDGTAGSVFDVANVDDVLPTSVGAGGIQVRTYNNPGVTVFGGSSTASTTFRADSGTKNMKLTVGPGSLTNSVGFGILELLYRKNNTTASGWVAALNNVNLGHLGILENGSSSTTFSAANGARFQLFSGGGLGMAKRTTDPTLTLTTNELAIYCKSNVFGVTPFLRNSDGIFSVPFYLGHGATTPTIGLEPGNMWISNAVLPTVRSSSAFIALETVDVGTAQITATNSVVTTAANKTRYLLDPSSDLTLNNTGQVSDGYPGQVIYLYTASGEANTVTFQDQGTVAGSNLELGAATRTVAANDVLVLLFNGTDWVEVSYANN